MTGKNRYNGNNNYGKPKQEYLDKLKEMPDKELGKQCDLYIWLSAYANNNPGSDYHWQCDACYDECVARDRIDIYELAYKQQVASVS